MIIQSISDQEAMSFANTVFAQQEISVFGEDYPDLVKEQVHFAAYHDDSLVGVVSGKQTWENVHITALAVTPTYQGQGLGSRLLVTIEDWARTNQLTSVTLSTKSYQAKEFYVKQGYQLFAELHDVPMKGVTKSHFVKYL